jgi:hypothetical protein
VLTRPRTARQASGRGALLLPAGALVVHQLRYWLAYGPHSSSELADQGHAYLGSLVPWIVLVSATALGLFVARIVRASRYGLHDPRRAFRVVWLGASASLLAIYVLQELLEELFAAGHPGGIGGVFGHGGWWAVPASIAIGLAIACLLRASTSLIRLVAGRAGSRSRASSSGPRPRVAFAPRSRPLATAAAGRAPPPPLVACA